MNRCYPVARAAKKLVGCIKQGKVLRYRAAVSRPEIERARLTRTLSSVLGDGTRPALATLVEVMEEIRTTTDLGGGHLVTTCMPTTSTVCDEGYRRRARRGRGCPVKSASTWSPAITSSAPRRSLAAPIAGDEHQAGLPGARVPSFRLVRDRA
jgi:hypothetical protein